MYNPPAIKSSKFWPLLKIGFSRFVKDFFSLKSFYVLAYNFVPFLGVILNYYDFYTLIFVYLFETVILAFFAIYKTYYFKWEEVMIYAPVTIIIVGFVTFFVCFVVVGSISSGQPFKLSSLLLHYPLKSPLIVIANLIYYTLQEGYLMIKSMQSGVMSKVKSYLSSNLIKTQKDYLFNIVLNQINPALVRASTLLVAAFFTMFVIFPAAIIYIFIRAYSNSDIPIEYIFTYSAMFSVCLWKGIFDILTRINEKYDSEKLKEFELKLTS
ncbi:MAG: hypothetical protein WC668_01640 [Patescibacteria group bacterium]|jgi:hypothetical protein